MSAPLQRDPIVRIRGLRKTFGDREVLKGIDLDVPENQIVCVIGGSGSGKSTLLRVLMALERPDAGRVEIAGQSVFSETHRGRERTASDEHVRTIRTKVGMVFQHFNLFPHMSVLQNVMEAPVHVLGLNRGEARDRAAAFLERVGLSEKLGAYPQELSGGQKQRVAIARALAMQPPLMLFDEVTSALDPELVSGILDLLRELSASRELTMIIVTHEMAFARDISERVLFLDNGVVAEDAPPGELFTTPRNERTRTFLKNFLSAANR